MVAVELLEGVFQFLQDFFHLFSYRPIRRGAAALLTASFFYPLAGVFILRLQIVSLRFALMHGTLLGGAAALALGGNPVLAGIAVNVIIVLSLEPLSRRTGLEPGNLTAFFMVASIGLAFAVIYKARVPAQDAFGILWGNLYAMTPADFALTLFLAFLLGGGVLILRRQVMAVLFDREVAWTAGVPSVLLMQGVMVLIGAVVAVSMKLIGALLLDAVLILPALGASLVARSGRQLFLLSSGLGFAAGLGGLILSVAADLPASSAVTLVMAAIFLGLLIFRRRRERL